MKTFSKIALLVLLITTQACALNETERTASTPSAPIIHSEQQKAVIQSIKNSLLGVISNRQVILTEPHNGPRTADAIGSFLGNKIFLNRFIDQRSDEFSTLHAINDLLYQSVQATNSAKQSIKR